MADNRSSWDEWRGVEDMRSSRKSVKELYDEGYTYYKQNDFRRAAEWFRQAAMLAETQGDTGGQCKNLDWEGTCWYQLDNLKKSLERLLRAEELGGGDAGVRFYTLADLFLVSNAFPLPLAKQEELLKKLLPYKGSGQIGGSKSFVLSCERLLLADRGNWRDALDRAQEAFSSQVHHYPSLSDRVYYETLVNCYRENNLLPEAWKTLRDWREHGSDKFSDTKSRQFRAEAQLLYVEGRLGPAWDAIRRCQVEEQYLNIYGQDKITLIWFIRIAVEGGWPDVACAPLPLLFRWHAADSLYDQYDCFYWFAYCYAGLATCPQTQNSVPRHSDTVEVARVRAARWYRRAARVGRELDELLDMDVKQKELEKLRAKLSEAGVWEEV